MRHQWPQLLQQQRQNREPGQSSAAQRASSRLLTIFLYKAYSLMVPENQSQRQAFKQLMPHLYVLREKGCSFQQLTGLLDQCGLKLQPSTVRRYYNEMLADRMEACKNQMKLHMESLAAVKRENLGIDMQAIATKLDKEAAQRRDDVDAMLAHLLGIEYRKP